MTQATLDPKRCAGVCRAPTSMGLTGERDEQPDTKDRVCGKADDMLQLACGLLPVERRSRLRLILALALLQPCLHAPGRIPGTRWSQRQVLQHKQQSIQQTCKNNLGLNPNRHLLAAHHTRDTQRHALDVQATGMCSSQAAQAYDTAAVATPCCCRSWHACNAAPRADQTAEPPPVRLAAANVFERKQAQ